jgi:hypothetical protein
VGEGRKEEKKWIGFDGCVVTKILVARSSGIPQVSLYSFSGDLDENFVSGAHHGSIFWFSRSADLP